MVKRFRVIKDTKQERMLFGRRVLMLAAILGLLVLLLGGRLLYLQSFQHMRYTTLAQKNQLNLLPLEPNRGLIYDRYGILLAEDIPVFDLVITPSRVKNLRQTISALQAIIPITRDDIQQFNRQLKLRRQFELVPLRTGLTELEVARFSIEQYRFPGVAIRPIMIRRYPEGEAFAQAVGYVGRINAHELAVVDSSNYSATNFIGKTGVEKYYEDILHGTVGYQQQETDAMGHVVRVLQRIAPVPGNDLYLTIDSQLQKVAQQALGEQHGAIVAIDPQNGEILALVSNPSFDPNLFVAGISREDYERLRQAPGQPLYNRALRGQYAPGSTIKPFMALAGLSSGVITPEYAIFDPGWYQLKGSTHVYHDKQRSGHGWINLSRAIMVSCDTYFYNLAFKLGIERIDNILQQFGFGQSTNVDLNGAAAGLVPSPAWKQHKKGKSWYPGDTIISGIGQGFMLATPLQLADAAAALAMRGRRWTPHVLWRSRSADGKFTVINPTPLVPVILPDNDWTVILDAMQDVAKKPGGTAYRSFNDAPYTVAAKTGTAQVFSLKKNQRYQAHLLPVNLRDNSLFIAFAPVENPRIALAVIVQNSSVPAAAVARQVLDDYLVKRS